MCSSKLTCPRERASCGGNAYSRHWRRSFNSTMFGHGRNGLFSPRRFWWPAREGALDTVGEPMLRRNVFVAHGWMAYGLPPLFLLLNGVVAPIRLLRTLTKLPWAIHFSGTKYAVMNAFHPSSKRDCSNAQATPWSLYQRFKSQRPWLQRWRRSILPHALETRMGFLLCAWFHPAQRHRSM